MGCADKAEKGNEEMNEKETLAAGAAETAQDLLPMYAVASDQYVLYRPGAPLASIELGRCVQVAVHEWLETWSIEGSPLLGLTPNDLVSLGIATMRSMSAHTARFNPLAGQADGAGLNELKA